MLVQEHNQKTDSSPPGSRLMVIDDNYEFTRMVQALLQLQDEFTVDRVETLSEMWRLLKQATYDLLILDYHLPDGTGLDALSKLAAVPHSPPVLMITGEGDERIASEAIKRGAYDYIVKSGDMTNLPLMVRKALQLHAARRAQAQAEDRVHYQAWLLNNVSDAVVVTDLRGRISFWNSGAVQLFGVSEREALGNDVVEMLCPKDDRPCEAQIGELFSREHEEQELELEFSNHKYMWVSAKTSILMNPDRSKAGRMVIFRDITQRKKLESRVREAQIKLLQAARLSAVGELASSMAHQINNPLTTILGETQILVRQLEEGSVAHQAAQAVEEAGWRAANVVQQLMDLSSSEETSIGLIDVNATILSATELVGSRLERSGAAIGLSLAPRLPKVVIKERDLLDVWINLLFVARDAALDCDTAEIRIESKLESGWIQVDVNFPGDLSVQDESQNNEIEHGQVLGVAIAQELIRRYQGRLTIRSEDEKNNKITVELQEALSSVESDEDE